MKKFFVYIVVCILVMNSICIAQSGFKNITPEELRKMIDENGGLVLIDVHIPEQKHLEATDDFIPYNEIKENKDRLPQDKERKIVLYCRSGSMSDVAAGELVEMGYTDVYNLVGGIVAWKKAGFSVDGPDQIKMKD